MLERNWNHVQLWGTLGSRPHITTMPSGAEGTNFVLLVDEYYTDKQGRRQHKVNRVWCSAWNQTAAEICRYCDEGDELFVSGKLSGYEVNGVDTVGVVVREVRTPDKGIT